MPTNRSRYPRFQPRLDDAAVLQRRIAAGKATADEAVKYGRILTVLRAKFRAGTLSDDAARRFGIE
jgi:hypothetical protein